MKYYLRFLGLLVLVFNSGCNEVYAPKPRGYHRIVFPEKGYTLFESNCNYQFDYPSYGKVVRDTDRDSKPCWYDVDLAPLNGKIHLSYYDISDKNMFINLTEDARTLAYKHTIKADEIKQAIINRPEDKVYGIYYLIEGNTASQIQFFATDSVQHYLRGSLYFNSKPQIDSLKPVLDFVKEDIDHLLKTIRWK